jgi:hypothetical protein
MTGKDMILISKREVRRLHVVQQVIEKKMTQGQGALVLGVTGRQIRRIVQRVQKEGESGVCHRGRGKPSNRRMPWGLKEKALGLYQKHYADFGPTLATEKLLERHDIPLGKGTRRLGWARRRLLIRRGRRGLIANGGRGNDAVGRCCRWMVRIMPGLKTGGRAAF